MTPRRITALLIAATAATGCTAASPSVEPDGETEQVVVATSPPTDPPGGSPPPGAVVATTSPAAPTTSVTLPTVVSLPTPAPAPLDETASEPVVALGSIAIPAIGIDRPLFEGIRLPTFDLGPGHWPGTAMPGQVGNMVIGGHRTEGHADFGDLDLLQPGDEVIVTDTGGAAHTYRVDATEIIDPFAAKMVNQTPARTATLFACHPKGSTDRRIVVHLSLAT